MENNTAQGPSLAYIPEGMKIEPGWENNILKAKQKAASKEASKWRKIRNGTGLLTTIGLVGLGVNLLGRDMGFGHDSDLVLDDLDIDATLVHGYGNFDQENDHLVLNGNSIIDLNIHDESGEDTHLFVSNHTDSAVDVDVRSYYHTLETHEDRTGVENDKFLVNIGGNDTQIPQGLNIEVSDSNTDTLSSNLFGENKDYSWVLPLGLIGGGLVSSYIPKVFFTAIYASRKISENLDYANKVKKGLTPANIKENKIKDSVERYWKAYDKYAQYMPTSIIKGNHKEDPRSGSYIRKFNSEENQIKIREEIQNGWANDIKERIQLGKIPLDKILGTKK